MEFEGISALRFLSGVREGTGGPVVGLGARAALDLELVDAVGEGNLGEQGRVVGGTAWFGEESEIRQTNRVYSL